MTKVITYNNIQLSFQADTSGIKASKAELGALTREVNAQRTPLEKFMRQLEVINQQSAKMAPKDVDARLRAVTRRFIDAEAAAGNYNKALYTVGQLVPQLADETARLAMQTRNAEMAAKDFAATEQAKAARLAAAEQEKANKLAAEEQLRKRQSESKRLQVERQVLQFKKEQHQQAIAIAKQDAQIAEKQAANRRKLLKQERDDYVTHYDMLAAASKKIQSMVIQPKDLELINLQIAKEKELAQIEIQKANRRRELERMVRRIFQNEGEIIATNRRRARREAEEYKKEVLAKYDAEIAAQEKRNQILLKEEAALREKQAAIHRTLLKQERDEYVAHYDRLAAASKKLQTLLFAPAENARILAERSAAAELELQNQRMGAGLGIQVLDQSKQILNVRRESAAAIQAENKNLAEQQKNLTAIESLEQTLSGLKRQQLSTSQQNAQELALFRQREMQQAQQLAAEMKARAAQTMGVVDPAEIKKIFAAAEVNIQKFANLQKEVEIEQGKINAAMREQNRIAEANARLQSLVIQPMQHQRILRQRAIADERRHNAELERQRQIARENRRDLITGAAMGGMPGGMLFGMSRLAIGGFAVAGGIAASLKAYSDMRDKLVVLEAQFKSTALAAQVFGDIRRLAAQSPLETNELMKAAVVLSQYGFAASEIVPTLKQLTAISTGNAARMEGLARAFAQVKAAGRLMGQEVLQFTNSGFSPLNEMARVTGIEMSRLKKLMEEGKISFQDTADALKSATSEGGAFFGQTEKQAQELSARFNELKDSVKQLGEAFGELFSEPAKQTMSFISNGFKMMAAGGKFTASLITDLFSSEFHKLDELARKQKNLQRRMDLDARIHDIYAQMAGLDVGGIAEKDGKLFENLKQQDKAMEARRQAEKMEAIVKKQRKIEEFDDTSKIKKLEDEIAKSTMTKFQYAQREAKIRLDEITREANERLSLEIELDKLRGSTGERHAKLIEEQTRITENKIAAAKRDLERLPFLDAASKINEEERKKFLKENPQVKVMQQAKQIADMIRLNMINQDAGARALAEVMMENTEATKQQSQELPKTIQAGTVEAYQAMFGRDNTAKLQLAEQKKQVTKQAEANKLLEKIANKPGMKKV